MSSKCITLHNGVLMPMMGYGTWQGAGDPLRTGLRRALEIGYRHIDTACIYRNEDVIGDVLQQWFASGSAKREDLFITTKLPPHNHRRPDVERSLRESLGRLKLNYVDLFLVHTPLPSKLNAPSMHSRLLRVIVVTFRASNGKTIELVNDHVVPDDVDHLETWKGMEDVLNGGLTRSVGLSNFNIGQIERVLNNCTVKPHNLQVECHLYWPQFELHDFCKKHNISFTAYAPIGSPGRRNHRLATMGVDISKQHEPLDDPLAHEIAMKHGKSAAQVLMKWLLQRDIIIIPKSTTPSHIVANFQLFDFELSDNEMKALNEVQVRERLCPFYWAKDHPHYPFER